MNYDKYAHGNGNTLLPFIPRVEQVDLLKNF